MHYICILVFHHNATLQPSVAQPLCLWFSLYILNYFPRQSKSGTDWIFWNNSTPTSWIIRISLTQISLKGACERFLKYIPTKLEFIIGIKQFMRIKFLLNSLFLFIFLNIIWFFFHSSLLLRQNVLRKFTCICTGQKYTVINLWVAIN